jgi:hypothetical protein
MGKAPALRYDYFDSLQLSSLASDHGFPIPFSLAANILGYNSRRAQSYTQLWYNDFY